MNNLTVFNNKEFGEVRGILINGEPYLVGKDVVKNLGYDLEGKHVASEYIKKYCDKEDYVLYDKNSPLLQESVLDYKELGQRGGYLINESAVYALIFGSKLPKAKEFKRWVTAEVLPTIRKHGAYMTPEVIEKTLTDPDFLIRLATELKEEKVKRTLAEQKVAEAEKTIKTLQP